MSIERSAAATSPKAVAGAESHGAKSKANAGDGADAAAGGGFLALLASFVPDAEMVGTEVTDPGVGTDVLLLPAAELVPLSDPALALAPDLPSDLSTLLAQAGVLLGGAGVTPQGAGVATQMSSPAQPPAQPPPVSVASASPALSPMLELPTDLSRMPERTNIANGAQWDAFGDERSVGIGEGPALAGSMWRAHGRGRAVAELDNPVTDKSADGAQKVDLLAAQPDPLSLGRHLKGRAGESPAASAAALAELRELKTVALGNFPVREPTLAALQMINGLGDGLLRQPERAAGKPSALPSSAGLEGLRGPQSWLTGSPGDAAPALADPTMASLESMVADKVSYWVAQGVQTAQLKLDGLGSEPVEVSISLKGDQAHIGFRTDQPEIRQLLEGATAHLKQLLTSEGLVLSGVSVGTSAHGGKGAQEQQQRANARQGRIVTADVTPTDNSQRVRPSAGRAVDLFV